LFARRRRVPIVAITDSEVSPLAKAASRAVIVGTKSKSFFQTMVAVSAAAETLATISAMRSPDVVMAGLKDSEDYFKEAKIYWAPGSNRLAEAATRFAPVEEDREG
jgi:DNA-binding MurR/RpiR family transcriptional regulator